jgi:hypothetical protein
VFPGESTKENRDAVPFRGGEGTLNRAMEVGTLAGPLPALEAAPFLFDPLLNLLLNVVS